MMRRQASATSEPRTPRSSQRPSASATSPSSARPVPRGRGETLASRSPSRTASRSCEAAARTPTRSPERSAPWTPRSPRAASAAPRTPREGRAGASTPQRRAPAAQSQRAAPDPVEQAKWANALWDQRQRLEQLLTKQMAFKTALSDEKNKFSEGRRLASVHATALREAIDYHSVRVVDAAEQESSLAAELESLREAETEEEAKGQQMSSGIRAKESELEGCRQQVAVLRENKEGKEQEAKMKIALAAALRAAHAAELKNHARRDEQLAQNDSRARHFHNEYLSLKGNIRVFCRLRPPLSQLPDDVIKVDLLEDAGLTVHSGPLKSTTGLSEHSNTWHFDFDHVFGPASSQSEVFEEISLLVQSALDGYKVAIFAYGQTGSGKTHTMEGPPTSASAVSAVEPDASSGVIPRSVDLVFAEIDKLGAKGWNFEVHASILEVYNEAVHDLAPAPAPSSAAAAAKPRHSRSSHDLAPAPPPSRSRSASRDPAASTAEDLVRRCKVTSATAVHALLRRARRERHVAATNCNARSSRSHAVFQLFLSGRRASTGEEVQGLLSLVDLAGSERVEKSGAAGERMREAQHINRSLSALGDVIEALARKKMGSSHVPYRNSRLTMLLKDSLGGESKALMFVNIASSAEHLNETLSSLRFASKVHACNVGKAKRQATDSCSKRSSCKGPSPAPS